MADDTDLREKKAKVPQAQQKLLKRVQGSEYLEVSWQTTCTDASLLQVK